MIHHFKRATRHLIFWSLLSLAISLTGVRVLLSSIASYQTELAERISEQLGTTVKIGHLGAKMRGFSPELILKDITIASVVAHDDPAIQLKEIRLGINLLELLVSHELLASSRVRLIGAKLSVTRKQDGSIAIVGLKAGDEQPLWLLQGRKYEVLHSEITWRDEKTRGKALTVESVDLAIINSAQQHKINAILTLPKKLGSTLTVAMVLHGNFFEPSALNGSIYLAGKNVQLSAWQAALGLSFAKTIASGTGDIKIWSEIKQSQLVSVTADVQGQQLKMLSQDSNQTLTVKQLATHLHWRLQNAAWRLDVGDFLLETVDAQGIKKWSNAVFSVAGFVKDSNFLHKIALFTAQLDVAEVSQLAQFFVPSSNEMAKKLTQAQLKGRLENFSLFVEPDENRFAVNGKFLDLGVMPFANIPEIQHVSGSLRGNETSGYLQLTTENAQVVAADVFRETLTIKQLNGTFNWRQTATERTLSSPLIELNLSGFQSKSRLSLSLPKNNAPPFLDLQSAFSSDDVGQLPHYFPTKVMKPADVDWFDRAFPHGLIRHGGLLYVGKLGVFPAKAEDGVFQVGLEVDQLELAFAPDWPLISDIAGNVVILQAAMTCDIHQGQSHNLHLNQATVINPALGKSKWLQVKGSVAGKITDAFKFLQQTPLNSEIGFLVDAVEPHGDTEVALDLTLPLAVGMLPKVYGAAQLHQAKLKVSALDLWVNNIEGVLKFTEHGVYSDLLEAAALNRPIKVTINRQPQQQTFVNITGSAGIDALQQQFNMPGWSLAQGEMAYQLKLGLPYPNSPSELVVESDLTGVALNFPRFLAKTKAQTKPLLLTFDLGEEALLPIAINYDNALKAAVKLDLVQHRLHSGQILVGAGKVAQAKTPGLTLAINQTPLNLQDWLGFSVPQSNNGDTAETENTLKQIHIHSQQAQWKNTQLGIFDLLLKPDGQQWLGSLNSELATGKIRIPADIKGAEKITLALTELDFSALTSLNPSPPVQENATEPTLKPADLPLLSLTSDKTRWRSVDLGRLTLETERLDNGMVMKQLALTGKGTQLKMSGDWKPKGQQSETRLQGRLELPNAGDWLAQLAISKELMESTAVVDFSGDWQAAPYQFSLAEMRGQLDVNLTGGRILSVEPGVGRLLGIMAMAQWVKRVQLDFSDVYAQGLTFNTISGHFDVLNGIATTRHLIVDAIPATITLSGDADLVNGTVNQRVNVAPKSADALPIAGTLMGKVTTLLARTMTGEDHEGFFFGSEYRVTGKWDNLVIVPLHENDGLFQKTWAGITDFPWLNQQK